MLSEDITKDLLRWMMVSTYTSAIMTLVAAACITLYPFQILAKTDGWWLDCMKDRHVCRCTGRILLQHLVIAGHHLSQYTCHNWHDMPIAVCVHRHLPIPTSSPPSIFATGFR